MKMMVQLAVMAIAAAILVTPVRVECQEITALTVAPDGKVGIGTAEPEKTLHVSGGGMGLDNNQWLYGKETDGSWRTLIGKDANNNTSIVTRTSQGIVFSPGNLEKARITKDKVYTPTGMNLGLGTSSFQSGTSNVFCMSNGIAPASGPPNAALFVVLNGEMWVYDSNGNGTILSSHPSSDIEALAEPGDPYPHFEKARNEFLGKEIVVDKGKAFRLLQSLFPNETFVWYRDLPSKEAMTPERRETWKASWIAQNMRETEISKQEAFAQVDVIVEDKTQVVGEKISYAIQGREVVEVRTPAYSKRTEQKWLLKQGVRFDEETGKFYGTIAPTEAEAEAAVQKAVGLGLKKWVTDRLN